MSSNLFALVCLACLLAGRAQAAVVERIVAVVNKEVITLYELDQAMVPHVAELKGMSDKALREARFKEIQRQVLNQLIDDHLLSQTITSKEIKVTDEDLVKAVQSILTQNRITIEQLQGELASKGIPYEAYKEELRRQIRRYKFINQEISSRVQLSEEELKHFYERHREQFGDQSYDVVKERISARLYDERLKEELNQYLLEQRQKAYIDVRL